MKRVAAGLVGLAALAYLCGTLLRLGALPGRWGFALAGYAGLLAALWIISRLLRELALMQGRQTVEAALAGLGPEWHIYSSVRLVGGAAGAAVADYLAVGPGGRAWPLIVDTTSPRGGRRTEEVLARAARTAAAVRAAQAQGALPAEVGVDPAAPVTAVVVAVRRRVETEPGAEVSVVNPKALVALLGGGAPEATGPPEPPAGEPDGDAVPGADVAERSS